MIGHDARASNLGRDGRSLEDIPFCGYSPVPSDPTVPLCNRPAAAHICPLDRGQEAIWTIFACAEHAPLASAETFDWHPLGRDCTAPSHVWVHGTAFRHSSCAITRNRATTRSP